MKMKKLLALSFILSNLLFLNAQSLSYSGTNSFNISAPTHLNANIVPSLERTPTGIAFGDNGTKVYLVGTQGDFVVQYDLSTAYEYSSRGTIQSSYRMNSEETSVQDIIFNDVGTRMYITGQQGDDITQYTLSTAWDVSTATSPVVFDADAAIDTFLGTTTDGDLLTGIRFNDDGSKFYVVDRSADSVFEFSLSTNYDITTAGVVDVELDIIAQQNSARGIEFNNDGTRLYVIGTSGDNVDTFPLTIAYDISSAGTPLTVSTTLDDTAPQALLLNDDGTTFYICGSGDDEIKEYSISVAYDFSSTITLVESNAFPTREIAPRGMVFNNDGTKLFVAGDQVNVISELALSTPYDISTNTLSTGLFINNEELQVRGLTFNNTGTTLYIIGANGDEINGYDLSSAYDLTSTITTTTGSPFNISAEDSSPSDIYFNNDGTKLYVLGSNGDDLNQYSLSPAYDLTDAIAANLDIAFPLNNVAGLVIDSAPFGMTFNNDGSKLYIAGNAGNDINEISLSVNFDLSTGTITNTNTFSVNTEEATITDVIFNADGSKFFITGAAGDDMNQYQTKGLLPETSTNDGTIDNTTTLVITITGDTFVDLGTGELTDVQVTIGNLPSEVTGVFALSGGNTIATLTISGNVEAHLNSNDIDNLTFTFTNSAFTSSTAATVANAVGHTNIMGIDYIDCSQDIVYNGSWSGGSGPSGAPDNTNTASGVSVQADITITADTNCDCLNVANGQTLTVADGVRLTVTNAVELIGNIVLLGDSQLVQTHTDAKNIPGSGTLTLDKTGTLTNVYQSGFWSSPVSDDGLTYTIGGVMKDGTSATTLDINFTTIHTLNGDGTTVPISIGGRWLAKLTNALDYTRQISASSFNLNPGEGYNMKSTGGIDGSSTQNYRFVGSPNDGEYLHTIGDVKLSLLGNPYPSELDANDFITANTDAIDGTLYFYESGDDTSHVRGLYTGGYATYNGTTGVPFSGGKTPDRYISVGQGFFVFRDVANLGGTGTVGTDADIVFNNDQRATSAEGGSSIFFSRNSQTANKSNAEKKKKNKLIRVGFDFAIDETRNFHRQLAIGFNGNTDEYENGFDSGMFDKQASDMALTVRNYASPCVIIGREYFNKNIEIPLQVFIDQTREVTFSIDGTTNLKRKRIFLKDNVTNEYFNIKKESKTMELAAGTYTDRFSIVFVKTTTVITAKTSLTEEVTSDDINVYHNNDTEEITINLFNDTSLQKVEVYNLLGQKVKNFNNNENLAKLNFSIAGLKQGFYIVKVISNDSEFSKKIIVE